MAASPIQSLHQTVQQHLQAGQTQQAAEVLREIVRIYPREPRAHLMLGVMALQAGQPAIAVDWLSKTIAIDPSFADAYFIRATIFQQNKQLIEAIADYRAFLIRRPGDGKGLNNLGRAVFDQGNVSQGITILRQAIVAAPGNAGAHNNLGEALRTSGDFAGAIARYKTAIEISPNSAEMHSNLGAALIQNGDRIAGVASMRRAVEINPRLFNAHLNLTRALINGGPLDEALISCRRALELQPDSANAIDLMGNLLGLSGQVPQCLSARYRAVELKPTDSAIHSNLLMTLHYLDDQSPGEIFKAHLHWAENHTTALTAIARSRQIDGADNRRLRIGYVSPNFSAHSVAYFFEPVLDAHDRSAVEIFCYSDVRMNDAVTKRMKSRADAWREITGKSDAEVATLIADDRIDILIDLAGHTADNRLPVFARRPAPIQMTWLGYPASTGMSAMDYRITDAITDPPGSESLHTEKLLQIPGGCWAYRAPEAPPIAEFPAVKNGFVTFGSFNNLPKVTLRVLQTWARILSQVPNSRLLLKASGLASTMGRDYVSSYLGQFGIEPDRFDLMNWTPTTTAHLLMYDRVDIALDTFPYNGTTTTCEAMWMGVPVIGFAGSAHVSRVGAALLTHAGCSEWIADDVEGYVTLAVQLASQVGTMQQVRLGLRDRLKHSDLCNATRIARELERIFKSVSGTMTATL